MKQKLASLANLAKRNAAGVGAAFMAGTTLAHAELPAAVGTTMTAISADATSIFGLVFPVVGVVVGLVIVIKLFKRFANRV